MIRTDAEYRGAVARLEKDLEVIELQKDKLRALDLTSDEVEHALQPARSFHAQLQEEVEAYERMKRGDLGLVLDLRSVGRVLIGLRIARGMSQRQLADALGVTEPVVSRDERNEYHGLSLDRAQKVIDALNGQVRLKVEVKRDIPAMATA